MRTVKNLVKPLKISETGGLSEFLESRSAYLVQKSITEYSQARANMLFSTLLGERIFQDAYETSRWVSYPAAFSMVAEACEGYIRGQTGTAAGDLDGAILAMAAAVFDRFRGPSGRPPAFWDEAIDRLRRDLAQAALAAPKPVHVIALARAQEIFEALPVSPEIRHHDLEMFRNTLRFHLTEIRAEFEERADAASLLRSLC